jgi:ribosomal protein S18 acetylase RimI-like enzyme
VTRFAVRPADAGDLDTLLALAEAFHAEDGHALDEGGRGALAAIAAGEPLARAWLFELEGRAVGYGVLTLGFSVEYGGRDGFIDDLYLAPVARGRGLGRQAMAFLEAQARELGIKALHLEVGTENARALGLYRRSGFRDNGRRLMCKRLV